MAFGDTLAAQCAEEARDASSPPSIFFVGSAPDLTPVLRFNASTQNNCYFDGVLPRHYAGGNINLVVRWYAIAANTGNVVWGAKLQPLATGSVVSIPSGTAASNVTDSAPGTIGNMKTTTIPITSSALNSIAAGNGFRLTLSRIAADAADTMAGDAAVVSWEMAEA